MYYTDFDKTDIMTEEEVGRLADVHGKFFTSQEWHIKHCSYNWRKLFRQKQTGVTLERRSNTYGHLGHCEDMFLLRDPLGFITTGSGVELNAELIPHPHKHEE